MHSLSCVLELLLVQAGAGCLCAQWWDSEISEHRAAAASLPQVLLQALLMLLPRLLTHSQEFKGSRENPECLLQLRSTISGTCTV